MLRELLLSVALSGLVRCMDWLAPQRFFSFFRDTVDLCGLLIHFKVGDPGARLTLSYVVVAILLVAGLLLIWVPIYLIVMVRPHARQGCMMCCFSRRLVFVGSVCGGCLLFTCQNICGSPRYMPCVIWCMVIHCRLCLQSCCVGITQTQPP